MSWRKNMKLYLKIEAMSSDLDLITRKEMIGYIGVTAYNYAVANKKFRTYKFGPTRNFIVRAKRKEFLLFVESCVQV